MNNLQVTLVIILGMLLVNTTRSQAQNQDRKTWLTAYFGHQEYDGDIGNEMLDFNLPNNWTGGIGIGQYLHNKWNLELLGMYGKMGYVDFNREVSFKKEFLNLNGLLKFNPLVSKSPVQPTVASGVGITSFFGGGPKFPSDGPTIKDRLVVQVPFQVGLDIRISNQISATANTTYNRTFSDSYDGRGGPYDLDNRNHDDFIVFSVGLKFAVSKSTDRDRDGTPNRRDACPDEYGKSFFGCPDQDNDGTIDSEDECPTIAGSSNMNGCPDSDRDGVSDIRDACPKIKGNVQSKGCPDRDGDGISDQVDQCPEEAGNPEANGCPPDSDGDGIVDKKDKCPQTIGPASNSGCPIEEEMVTEKEQEAVARGEQLDLETIAHNIQFSSNSSTLVQSSHDDLDQLANMMIEDTDLRLIIRGHTDNVGDDNRNLELSVNRANAVKDYLVSQGVEANRIFAFGYGETKPVASNDTEEGRRQNRRVELELYHKQ